MWFGCCSIKHCIDLISFLMKKAKTLVMMMQSATPLCHISPQYFLSGHRAQHETLLSRIHTHSGISHKLESIKMVNGAVQYWPKESTCRRCFFHSIAQHIFFQRPLTTGMSWSQKWSLRTSPNWPPHDLGVGWQPTSLSGSWPTHCISTTKLLLWHFCSWVIIPSASS